MDFPPEILKEISVPNLVAIAAMLWFMNSRLDKKFEKIDQRFEKSEDRLKLIENDMIEIKTILRMKE